MRHRTSLFLLALALATGALCPRTSPAQVLDPIQYTLASGSILEYGCLGPCACPVAFLGPLQGTFTFYRTSVDPLFTHYALLNIAWTYPVPTGTGGTARVAHVRGSGTYEYGGEFALVQRMTLDLTTDDSLSQHFDSGVVPVQAPFPTIAIDAKLHVNACIDSVFQVIAGPPGLAGVDPTADTHLLRNLTPNPSPGDVELVLATRSSGRARVEVFDVRGRVVAELFDGPLSPGAYRLRWSGRDREGAPAGPGIYWIRAASGGRSEGVRIVRLR